MNLVPLRSVLFVPGDRPDRVDKAIDAGADAVIIDLEDAVPHDRKAQTRPLVRQKLVEHCGKMLCVRVNSLASGLMEEDLEQVMVDGLRCVVAPMVGSAEELKKVCFLIADGESRHRIEKGTISLIPLLETAAAVEKSYDIASAAADQPRRIIAAFGAADFSLDMRVDLTSDGVELLYARSRIAVASRAAGLDGPLDTPYLLDVHDVEALRREAQRARLLGFQGKLCIHPVQVPVCNEVFSPTATEVARARKIVEAFTAAESRGVASIRVDNIFVDYPVAARARLIVALADSTLKEQGGA